MYYSTERAIKMAQFSGNLGDVDIRLLRIFNVIAGNSGISGAAAELGVDHSTVSRQLSDLETRLGFRLCQRSRSGFWLTDAGHVVLERAQEMLSAIGEFQRHVKEIHKEISGEFVIGVAEGTIWDPKFALPEVIKSFCDAAPLVVPSIRVLPLDALERALHNRICQISLVTVRTRRKGFYYMPLYPERNSLYCGRDHSLYEVDDCSPDISDIRKEHVVGVLYESGAAAMIQSLELRRGPSTNTVEGISTFVQSGRYLGYLPDYYGGILVAQGLAARIATPGTAYNIDTCAMALETERKTAMTSLFIDHVKKVMLERQ
jgi:DNA-binding transcriptional LysR family regulator